MPRYVHQIPPMRFHKRSGQAYVMLDGKQVYLGRHGSIQAQSKYNQTIAEWLASDRVPVVPEPGSPGRTVSEVLSAFMLHAISYYRSASGEQTGEAGNFRDAIRPVRKLYEDIPAKDFGIAQLKAVRASMVQAGLSRSTVNARINRVRRVWKWAVSELMIPETVYLSLTAVGPLRKNRTKVKEAKGIKKVSMGRVNAALPYMPAPVAAMVQLQLLTGCRVGEILIMRGGDLDQGYDPWIYRPGAHKNDWREESTGRDIPIGPRGQAIIKGFLRPDRNDFLFDPRDVVAELRRTGKGGRPVRMTAHRYDRRTYGQAIYRACDKAFLHPTLSGIARNKLTPRQARELREWRKAHRWSPLQLRKTAGSRIREEFGLEAAQAVLGHAKADVTQLYAEKLANKARDIARTTG
jgi:integrase